MSPHSPGHLSARSRSTSRVEVLKRNRRPGRRRPGRRTLTHQGAATPGTHAEAAAGEAPGEEQQADRGEEDPDQRAPPLQVTMKASHLSKLSRALGVTRVRLPAEGRRGGTSPRARQGSEHRRPPARECDERPRGFAEDHAPLEDADCPRMTDRRQACHGCEETDSDRSSAANPTGVSCQRQRSRAALKPRQPPEASTRWLRGGQASFQLQLEALQLLAGGADLSPDKPSDLARAAR